VTDASRRSPGADNPIIEADWIIGIGGGLGPFLTGIVVLRGDPGQPCRMLSWGPPLMGDVGIPLRG
jgi:hypothetical protein